MQNLNFANLPAVAEGNTEPRMAKETKNLETFERINKALEKYYRNLGCNYRDNAAKGVFLEYCTEEELIDSELPIDAELGDEGSPTDCSYTWLSNKYKFPVPSNLTIPNEKMEEYIFYILQFCYKFNDAPSDHCMSYQQCYLNNFFFSFGCLPNWSKRTKYIQIFNKKSFQNLVAQLT